MNQSTAACPICGAEMNVPTTLEISELLTCIGCNNKVVVEQIVSDHITLAPAPVVGEDWGE